MHEHQQYFIPFENLTSEDLKFLRQVSIFMQGEIEEAIEEQYIGIVLPNSKMIHSSQQLAAYALSYPIEYCIVDEYKLMHLTGEVQDLKG